MSGLILGLCFGWILGMATSVTIVSYRYPEGNVAKEQRVRFGVIQGVKR